MVETLGRTLETSSIQGGIQGSKKKKKGNESRGEIYMVETKGILKSVNLWLGLRIRTDGLNFSARCVEDPGIRHQLNALRT